MRLALATLVAAVLVVPASASASRIAAGEGQSCQITSAGAALCWGSRGFGSLGDGLTSPSTSDPQQVSGLTSGVTHITSSWQGDGSTTATCAIADGAAKCWGSNYNGKLGNGSTATSSAVPVDVVGLQSGVTDLSTSAGRACAVHNGAAKCWGGYFLGDGQVMSSTVPVQVTGHTADVTSISAGWRSVCDVMAGSVYCWGATIHGQLGSPIGGNQAASPVAVTPGGPGDALKVAAGTDAACAIYDVNNGHLRCWGTNSSGQLGNGSGPDIETNFQVNVTGMDSGVSDISLNNATACAIRNALLYCWGENQYGMLGTGSSAASSNVPVQVPGLSNVTAVATSANHTCAIANGGTMYCWGLNQYGYLGNDTVPSGSRVPVPVIGSTPKPPVTTTPITSPITTVQPTPLPTATIRALAGKRKVSTKRTVTIATVSCPALATCAITAPKTVKLKLAKKSYTLTVSAAKTLAAGKKLNVGLTLPKKAYAKLKGKTASVSVKITATATGATPTTLTVRSTIKR